MGDLLTPARARRANIGGEGLGAVLPAGWTSVPQLTIWDDHDYGPRQSSDLTNPIPARGAGDLRQFWANPTSGLPDTPGVFFDYLGGVDFIFLDDRDHHAPDADEDTPGRRSFSATGRFEWLRAGAAGRPPRAGSRFSPCGRAWSRLWGPGGGEWSAYCTAPLLFNFIRDGLGLPDVRAAG